MLGYTRRARDTGPDGNIDWPDGIENQPDKLDELLEAVRDKHPDNGGLLTGVVLSASPTKVVVARSSKQIIDITNKGALNVIARGLSKNAKSSEDVPRGSVVHVHRNGARSEAQRGGRGGGRKG